MFIDSANLYFCCKELGWKVDYKKLLFYFKSNSELASIAFYGALNPDNHAERKFQDFLEIIGYTVKCKKIKFIKDKNDTEFGGHHKGNVDVDLTIDAVYNRDEYDTFILFSGDSDFGSLLTFLKRFHKRCIVVSTKGHVSIELIRLAKFIDLKKIRNDIELK